MAGHVVSGVQFLPVEATHCDFKRESAGFVLLTQKLS